MSLPSVTKPGPRKTRAKIPYSCTICRKRKIKCDKQKPHCGHCVSNQVTHLCHYETQPWTKIPPGAQLLNKSEKSELERLKLTVLSLEATIREKDSTILKLESLGPLITPASSTDGGVVQSLSAKIHFDADLKYTTVKDSKILQFGPTSYMFLLLNNSASVVVFNDYLQSQASKFNNTKISLENQLSLPDNELEIPLLNSIRKQGIQVEPPILPSLPIIKLLVYRFFEVCYPFVPFVDEKNFMNEISAIFRSKSSLDASDIRDKRFFVAILLIILRFAFLTVPFQSYYDKALFGQEYDMVHQIISSGTNIPSTFVEYAKQLLITPEIIQRLTFRNFQALLLLLMYRIYCPEDDDSKVDIPVLLSTTIEMSRNLSLNIDPTNLDQITYSNDDIQLWRKTWAILLHFDSSRAFSLGMSLLVQDEEIKTKSPFDELQSDIFWLSNSDYKLRHSFETMMECTNILRKTGILLRNRERGVETFEIDKLILDFHRILVAIQSYSQKQRISQGAIRDPHLAQNYMLQMSVLENLFVLNFMVYITIDHDLRFKYLCQAVELGFIIFKESFTFAENPGSIISPSFENLIAPKMWTPVRTVIVALSGVLNQALKGELSIIHVCKNFNKSEENKVVNWFIVKGDEARTLEKILQKFEELYQLTKKLSVKFFHCYRLCYTLKIVLDYFRKNYRPAFEDTDLDNLSLAPRTLNRMENYWSDEKQAHELNYDFEQFLNDLNFDLDPIMNFEI
ncbi:uncharacterized protein CANTADRAFT_6276 [Suhomyces tanzawaensis NRRL Y-17324]|uniref:Zn(2)-C6 fungal-type domain-containing protein n=1 Tax=Suhomyces tanzawaensis NRRL Y-17324 TaxID=984487 RepID=A0A1E4SHX1_9ASCO|nr:uncharacterized protein CANTADRAFT_6276 [Suhomyces tanzawaensis NRRL Y-17324]ODV79101.1 hypothetical protein CANTADRAFT_6276 [Suhomyces tanzawaensis NRRL Y-17324]